MIMDTVQAQHGNEGYKLSQGTEVHLQKAFADDHTLFATNPKRMQALANSAEEAVNYHNMTLKPAKCLAHGIANQIYDAPNIIIGGQRIPDCNSQEGNTFLGMRLTKTLNGTEMYLHAHRQLEELLAKIDEAPIHGPTKARLYEIGIIPRLRWTFTANTLTRRSAEKLEQKATRSLKKWLSLNQSATPKALYSELGLNLTRLLDLWESSTINRHETGRNSKDPKVQEAIHLTDSNNKDNQRYNSHNIYNKIHHSTVKGKTPQAILKHEQQTSTKTKYKELIVQGAWARLDKDAEQDNEWRAVFWQLPEKVGRFAGRAITDTLPSRINMYKWSKLGKDPAQKKCPRCPQLIETVAHVLTGCTPSADQGRYTWRHNEVLRLIAKQVAKDLPHATIEADLPEYPYTKSAQAIPTEQRPDLLVYIKNNPAVIIELTVPHEENIEKRHHEKNKKYAALTHKLSKGEEAAKLFCVEVGCRGLPGKSLRALSKWLKHGEPEAKQFRAALGRRAVTCSQVIWSTRNNTWVAPKTE